MANRDRISKSDLLHENAQVSRTLPTSIEDPVEHLWSHTGVLPLELLQRVLKGRIPGRLLRAHEEQVATSIATACRAIGSHIVGRILC